MEKVYYWVGFVFMWVGFIGWMFIAFTFIIEFFIKKTKFYKYLYEFVINYDSIKRNINNKNN